MKKKIPHGAQNAPHARPKLEADFTPPMGMEHKFSSGGLTRVPCPKPFHPVDYLEPEDGGEERTYELEGVGEVSAAALLAVVLLLAPSNPRCGTAWRNSYTKTITLIRALVPEVRNVSLQELAEITGTQKALLSFKQVSLADFAGVAAGKTSASRAKLSAARHRAFNKGQTAPPPDGIKFIEKKPRKKAKGEASGSGIQAEDETPENRL